MHFEMNTRHTILFVLTLVLFTLPSCKKEKKEENFKEFMTGTLQVSGVNSYLAPGQEITVTPFGISSPENVGYYWYNTWNSQKDTTRLEGGSGDGTYKIVMPEKPGNYTLTGIAFAKEYYDASVKINIIIVDNSLGGTLKNTEISKGILFPDERDDISYYASMAGGLLWQKNNLAWAGAGVSYLQSPVMDLMFGRFYTWEEAMTACPEGWRLPSDEDFKSLAASCAGDESALGVHETFTGLAGAFMVNATMAGERMWTYWPNVNISNSLGFCAIPVGYCVDMEGIYRFTGINKYAAFWTSDEEGDNGYYRYIYVKSENLMSGMGDKKSFRASVRCVQDL